MPLDPLLLEVLACPVDKGPLLWFDDEDILYNPRLHKSYRVVDGVPVMLVEEAADVMGLPRASAYRTWNYAKAWLRTKLADGCW